MADKIIAGVSLRADKPTSLTFKDLFHWVIWQFPSQEKKGLRGAVRPPLPDHEWYPAIIEANKDKVSIHAHVGKTFSTPEQAAKFFNAKKKSK